MVNQKTETKPRIYRRFVGVVTSNKMAKTIVVVVESTKIHRLYQKRYKVSQKFKVHDEKNQFKPGDKVEFVECRPLSKDKRWRVIKKIN
ncbi:MAG: 30S ribosomal protein S17 [Patescibacteria group bacterium]|jgi:small subunit ribosomal protein S17